ncbi:MAG: glutamine synthetase III [Lentisphaeria bacterium]|nr:glutamine synthetase III [Lentisphaeria bacterium]
MNCDRKEAIKAVLARKENCSDTELSPFTTENYGEDVFHFSRIKDHLPKPVYQTLMDTVAKGKPLDPSIADAVAHAMKEWALKKGATHYTHWFQPLTGATAEKHDSFLEPVANGQAILAFSGKNLIVSEPDASSFPSGGIRSTFEARGYTAWDPTSPAFIKRGRNGATLCIPTAFCAYAGEALDKKTPLLRSLQAISQSIRRLMKCFGNDGTQTARISLGPEQEYFLIDEHFYYARPDLVQTGRTLFGAPPPRHQQLDDHYFGAIRPRILAFMTDVDSALWRLGIPAKTRHNEVAPAQFEIAPVFEDLNLAVDHNMLVMEVLKQTAEKHGLICLLHEKPFSGVNGSGKHNNWSPMYGDINLLNPGSDPHQNAIFLTTLCAIIMAVDKHSDLLRSATASAGNDHRLGANEAPPAIISIFIGEQLTDIIDQIEKGSLKTSKHASNMRIGVDTLPALPRDTTDRNRTSPFAFTNNKFEFRAPGSSQSCAEPVIMLNTIVAEAFDQISDELEKLSPENFNQGLQSILRKIIKAHKRIIFNGDNYSEAWKKEAEKRGLPNFRTTPEAMKALIDPENIALLEKYHVFTEVEAKSRYEIFMEEYHRKIRIEGELSLNMARTVILPAGSKQLAELVKTIAVLSGCELKGGQLSQKSAAEAIGKLLDGIEMECRNLERILAQTDPSAKIVESMGKLRQLIDTLEKRVDDDLWPLPKYREMLFIN